MLQLSFKKVILKNFGSYADAELDLNDKGFCLVYGKNNCPKDNAESNGSGKSFLWSGICYALTGETINGLHSGLKNINVEDKEMYVELYFTADGSDYIIRRGQNPSKTLSITKDGNDMSGHTYTASVEKLTELLPELTRDLIASTILIGQGMPNKFSSFSPSGRKDLLERLTKSDFMIEDIKERVAQRKLALSNLSKDYSDRRLKATTLKTSAVESSDRTKKILDSLVKPDFDKNIKEAEEIIVAAELKVTASGNEIAELEKVVEELNTKLLGKSGEKSAEMQRLNENYNLKVSPLTTEKANLVAEINTLSNEIRKLKSIKDVCPTCGQKLVGVEKPDTSKQEKHLVELNERYQVVVAEISNANDKQAAYAKSINDTFDSDIKQLTLDAQYKKLDLASKRKEHTVLVQSVNTEKQELVRIKSEKEHWDEKVTSLQNSLTDDLSKIKELDEAIAVVADAQNKLDEHVAVVTKIDTLIKRDFRGYLLENIIKYIDQKAKDYCEIVFGTRDLEVYLDGNNLDISYCGKMMDNLSGGEKTRVDLILQLAIRCLLQNYLGFNSNILVLDEVTDFLDKQTCAAVMTLLEKETASIESVFIISHRAAELEIPIDSEIHVVKDTDGISRLN